MFKKLVLAVAAASAMSTAALADPTISISPKQAEAIVAECTSGQHDGEVSNIRIYDQDVDEDGLWAYLDFDVTYAGKYADVIFHLTCDVNINGDNLTINDLYEQ